MSCEVCKRKMNGSGCKGHFVINGVDFERIRFGDNGEPTDSPCPDCNATSGKIHHWHCDNEVCPKCRGQALDCDCEKFEVVVVRRVKA